MVPYDARTCWIGGHMKSRRLFAAVAGGALALALGAGCVGCAASAGTSAQDSASQADEGDVLVAVGDKASAAYAVSFSNGLGARITSLRLRASGAADYGDSLLDADQTIEKNEVVRLYVPQAQGASGPYDMLVTTESDKGEAQEVECDDALASEFDSVTLRMQDGEAFVDYVTTTYETGSTKEGVESGETAAGALDPQDIVLR